MFVIKTSRFVKNITNRKAVFVENGLNMKDI